jgi:PAS domain S-box-containing protein
MGRRFTQRNSAEELLRKSEALLAQAEAIANFGCWEREVKTGKITLSKQLLRLFGVSSDSGWDTERYWNNVLLNNRDRVRKTIERAIAECNPFEFEAPYRMPDGTKRVHHIRGVAIAGKDGTPEFVRGVVHDTTDQMRREEDLHRLSQELIRTQDAERRNLARSLHESAGQSLAALKMTLASLEDALAADPSSAGEILKSARGLAEDAVREVRVVSHLMHPPVLEEAGLGPALHFYVAGFSKRSGIEASVDVAGDLGRQPREIELTIFRIVQESLTNVHRYSGSPTVSIRLASKNSEIHVEIRDQGCGLPLPRPTATGRPALGVGIAGMLERVKQLNGTFEIETAPGRGTTVRAILPLSQDAMAGASVVPSRPKPKSETKSEARKGDEGLRKTLRGVRALDELQ